MYVMRAHLGSCLLGQSEGWSHKCFRFEADKMASLCKHPCQNLIGPLIGKGKVSEDPDMRSSDTIAYLGVFWRFAKNKLGLDSGQEHELEREISRGMKSGAWILELGKSSLNNSC